MEFLKEGLGEELKRLADTIRAGTPADIAFSAQRVTCRGEVCASKTAQEELAVLIAQAAHSGFPASTRRARSENDHKTIMMRMAVSGQTLGMLRRKSGSFQKKWIDTLIEMMAEACITSMEMEKLLRGGELSKTLFVGDGIDVGLGLEHGVIALEIYRVGGGATQSGNVARTLGKMLLAMSPEVGVGDEQLADYLRNVWRANGITWQTYLPSKEVLNQLMECAKEEAEPVEALEISRPEPPRPEPARSAAQRPRG